VSGRAFRQRDSSALPRPGHAARQLFIPGSVRINLSKAVMCFHGSFLLPVSLTSRLTPLPHGRAEPSLAETGGWGGALVCCGLGCLQRSPLRIGKNGEANGGTHRFRALSKNLSPAVQDHSPTKTYPLPHEAATVLPPHPAAHRWDVRASHLPLISSPTQLAHLHLSLPSPMFFHADLHPGRGEVELHRADLRPGKAEAGGSVRWGWTAGGVRPWGTRWIGPPSLSRMSGGAAEPQPWPLLFLSSSVLQHKC
jgi:hypothetical protein